MLLFVFVVNAQVRVMYYDYQNNFFNYNDPLPAEDEFYIQGFAGDSIEVLEIEIIDPASRNTIYKGKWKRNCGTNCDQYNVPVHFKLKESAYYNLNLKYFVKDINKTNLLQITDNQIKAYLEHIFVLNNSKLSTSKNQEQVFENLNDLILLTLNAYSSKRDDDFETFSLSIKNEIFDIFELIKDKADNNTLNTKVAGLIKLAQNEMSTYLNTEMFVMIDQRNITNYPTERVKSSFLMNLGYGAMISNNLTYTHAPFIGISVPLSKKPFYNHFSLSSGIYFKNFQNNIGDTLSGPLLGRPIYLALGYQLFDYLRLTAGTNITQNTSQNNNIYNFNNLGLSAHLGLALDINVLLSMGSKRLKVQKQLPQHQFNVPVYSMDDICLQNKPIIPDTIKNVKIYFDVNAHAIQDSSKATVKEISENLKASKERYYVVIAGYADITGDPAKNMELSKKRAEAIKNMLIEYDVNPRLIEIKYYGAVLEKDLNQARRVEVIFLKKTKRNSF